MKRIYSLGLCILAGISLGGCANQGNTQFSSAMKPHDIIANLSGSAEVPGPGSKTGTGSFTGDFNGSFTQLCYSLSVSKIAAPTAAHIHLGVQSRSGPPVLTLQTPEVGKTEHACTAIDPALARKIKNTPMGYYVNVHNAAYPDGAIRGQIVGGM